MGIDYWFCPNLESNRPRVLRGPPYVRVRGSQICRYLVKSLMSVKFKIRNVKPKVYSEYTLGGTMFVGN